MKIIFLCLFSLILFSCESKNRNTLDCPFANNYDNVECGIMSVSENRKNPDGGSLDIAYAIIKSKNKKYNDPVVYLMGGPGGSAIALLEFMRNHPVTNDRDFILVEQRGTKYSAGVCPEIGEKMIDIIAKDLTANEEYELLSAYANDCKDQMLKSGRDLSSINTVENARDIIELRKFLGYEEWNLYGGSYGTRLALEVANIDPTGIRSMVLAGPFSRDQKFYEDYGENFHNSLNRLFDTCENDPECNQDYPGLRSIYLELLDDLSTDPVSVYVRGNEFIINSADLALMLHQMLYSRQTLEIIPSWLTGFKNGNKDIIANGVYPLFYLSAVVDFGMYMSTQSYDEGWYDITESFKESETEFPEMKYGMAFHNGEVSITPEWQSSRYALEYKPENIHIPTLILAGEYDPVTPPSYGKAISDRLPESYNFAVPGRGHALNDRCSNAMILDFLNNPNESPSSECLENMPKISFN